MGLPLLNQLIVNLKMFSVTLILRKKIDQSKLNEHLNFTKIFGGKFWVIINN